MLLISCNPIHNVRVGQGAFFFRCSLAINHADTWYTTSCMTRTSKENYGRTFRGFSALNTQMNMSSGEAYQSAMPSIPITKAHITMGRPSCKSHINKNKGGGKSLVLSYCNNNHANVDYHRCERHIVTRINPLLIIFVIKSSLLWITSMPFIFCTVHQLIVW